MNYVHDTIVSDANGFCKILKKGMMTKYKLALCSESHWVTVRIMLGNLDDPCQILFIMQYAVPGRAYLLNLRSRQNHYPYHL